ncbi:MAG: protein kinase [Pirellulaceae bacterium]
MTIRPFANGLTPRFRRWQRWQHTHIAQLYSAGEQDGMPYFVMEYVDGVTLDQFADQDKLRTKLLAKIMSELCDAVQFCHDKDVLHRDLKPSNVLMTSSGQPKIADFGLAKALGADSSSTRTGEILGTPGYMSPEQASGVVKTLTPACDVYGLGAILYRLLTGRAPFVADEPFQTVMMVMSDEPIRPRKWNSSIPVDLETICLKCLEKKPQRRYATAAAMRADLQRFLDGRPIVARPANWFEKSWKWMRRNRAASVGMVAATLMIVAALIGLTMHNAALSTELARSRRLADHGSELSNWLIQQHLRDLNQISGTTQSRHDVVSRVKSYLDESYNDMPPDPKYTRRLGYSYSQLAAISGGSDQNNLGDLASAETNYLRALELYEQTASEDGVTPQIQRLQAEVYLALVDLYNELQRPLQSAKYLSLAETQLQTLKSNDWETYFLRILLADAQAEKHASANQHAAALKTLDQIQTQLQSVPDDADAVEVANQKIWVALNRGLSLEAMGQLQDSEASYQLATDLAHEAYQQDKKNPGVARRYSSTLVQLGDIQFAQENVEGALKNYQAGLEIIAELVRLDPQSVELIANQAQKHSRVSSALQYLERFDEAQQQIDRAIEIHRQLEQDGKASLSLRRNQALYVLSAAGLYSLAGQADEAQHMLDEHQQLCNRILQAEPNSAFEWNQLAENHFSYAVLLIGQWFELPEVPLHARQTAEYQQIVQHFDSSLSYFQKIEKQQGLTYHQSAFQSQVEATRKILEDSIDQMIDVAEQEQLPEQL